MPRYEVVQGDCLSSIASKHGFSDFNTIWNDVHNKEFKRERKDPNQLFPGDMVYIPEKAQKLERRGTSQTHTFSIKQSIKTIRIKLEDDEGHPLANQRYQLNISEDKFQGMTDGGGMLQQDVPMAALEGTLRVGNYVWPLQIGCLNPVANVPDHGATGIAARLRNLGYDPGAISAELDSKTRAAVAAFQRDYGLQPDGECGAGSPTLAKLVEVHGC